MEKWNDYDSGFARRMMDRVQRESRIPRAFFSRLHLEKEGERVGPVFVHTVGYEVKEGKGME